MADGSAAETAYQAALQEIERVRRAGNPELDLHGGAYAILERIPEEVATLKELRFLRLDRTKVSDLSPLRDLTALQSLSLNQTAVSDLSPLRDLTALLSLSLDQTAISDLSPLRNLTALQGLSLDQTAVSDFSPLRGLTALQSLSLSETAVSDLSPLRDLTALQTLLLSETAVSDVSPLRDLTALQSLLLDQSAVSDLSPLRDLTALERLSLSQTAVSDLSPLRDLAALQSLFLIQTAVSDLSPLRNLTALRTLLLDQTAVSDLRPIAALPFPRYHRLELGLSFSRTPATALDPELQRLSQIEDYERRTNETLAYLKTLPPWPEPLPWDEAEAEREVPQETSAPLQVIEVEGVLRPYVPPQGLAYSSADLARQGWAAVRDFLNDLAAIRPRIDNHVPNLGRALERFETALGASFDQVNAIALGTHGQRVIRMAASAGETLAAEDAAELQEFAAAIALHLERFPTWRAYRREALERPLSGDDVRKALPLVGEIVQALDDRVGIDPAIPGVLACCRFRGHEDKIVTKELESGYDETEVQP